MNLEHQAAAFLDFHRRRGGFWDWNFVTWSTSKDFHPSHARKIRRLVHAELFGVDVVAPNVDEVHA